MVASYIGEGDWEVHMVQWGNACLLMCMYVGAQY